MKLLKCMMKDLMGSKYRTMILIYLLISGVMLYWSYEDERYYIKDYRALIDDLEGEKIADVMDASEERLGHLLEIKDESINRLEEAWLDRFINKDSEYTDEIYQEMQMKSKAYLESKGVYSVTLGTDMFLLERLSQQVNYIYSMEEVLSQRTLVYERNLSRSYTQSDVQYWTLMMEENETIEILDFYDTWAMENFINQFSTDYIVILFIALSASFVLCKDYTGNRYMLIASTPSFPRKYVLYKMGMILMFVLLSEVYYIGMNLILYIQAGGNMQVFLEPVQIVSTMQNVVVNITVIGFIVTLIIEKMCFYILVAVLCMWFSCISKHYMISISLVTIVATLSYGMTVVTGSVFPTYEMANMNIFNIFNHDSILYFNEILLVGNHFLSKGTIFYSVLLGVSLLLIFLLYVTYGKVSRDINYL